MVGGQPGGYRPGLDGAEPLHHRRQVCQGIAVAALAGGVGDVGAEDRGGCRATAARLGLSYRKLEEGVKSKPSPSAPSRLVTGMRELKVISPELKPCRPDDGLVRVRRTPGWSASTRKADSPREPGPVRATLPCRWAW